MNATRRTALAALCGDGSRLAWSDWARTFTELADAEVQKVAAAVTAKALYFFWVECAADDRDLSFVNHFFGTGIFALYQATAICCHAPDAFSRFATASEHLRSVHPKYAPKGGALLDSVIEQLRKAGAVVSEPDPRPQALLELMRSSAALIGAHELNEALSKTLTPWLLGQEGPPFLGLFALGATMRLEDFVCPEEVGVRRVRGIYWETLRNMVGAGFADPERGHNRSPAIKDFLAFMGRFPDEVLAYGFYRDELVPEGVTVLKSPERNLSEGLREGFFELCGEAEESGETEGELYSWWD